jgi:hypothetical protein
VTRRGATVAISTLIVAVGITLIVETAIVDGTAGYLLGAALVLAGVARLYLHLR